MVSEWRECGMTGPMTSKLKTSSYARRTLAFAFMLRAWRQKHRGLVFDTPNQVRIFIYLNTTVPQPCYKLRMFLTVVNLELNTYIQVSRQSKCWLRLQQQKLLCCTWRKYSDYTKTVIYFWVKYFSSTSLLGNRGCGVTYFERLHCSASESNGGQQSWWKPCLRACHSHEALAVYQEVQ